MIKLSNGHVLKYVAASGALGFDGGGWLWDKPLIASGLVDPTLFAVGLRTLTRQPRLYPVSNLSWVRPWTWLPCSPWSCVRFLENGGAVNKVGLYNPGFDYWCEKIAPKMDFHRNSFVGSISGDESELVEMAERLNDFDLSALEINHSCPNTGHGLSKAEATVKSVKAIKAVSHHPIIIKVSVDQDYVAIAHGLKDVAEAISLNSVPWTTAFPDGRKSPLLKVGKEGSGGGGVSGRPAQKLNWHAVELLALQGALPVIGPGIMEFEDLDKLRKLGAKALSFGTIHLRTPWKPTSIVRREFSKRKHNFF